MDEFKEYVEKAEADSADNAPEDVVGEVVSEENERMEKKKRAKQKRAASNARVLGVLSILLSIAVAVITLIRVVLFPLFLISGVGFHAIMKDMIYLWQGLWMSFTFLAGFTEASVIVLMEDVLVLSVAFFIEFIPVGISVFALVLSIASAKTRRRAAEPVCYKNGLNVSSRILSIIAIVVTLVAEIVLIIPMIVAVWPYIVGMSAAIQGIIQSLSPDFEPLLKPEFFEQTTDSIALMMRI